MRLRFVAAAAALALSAVPCVAFAAAGLPMAAFMWLMVTAPSCGTVLVLALVARRSPSSPGLSVAEPPEILHPGKRKTSP